MKGPLSDPTSAPPGTLTLVSCEKGNGQLAVLEGLHRAAHHPPPPPPPPPGQLAALHSALKDVRPTESVAGTSGSEVTDIGRACC